LLNGFPAPTTTPTLRPLPSRGARLFHDWTDPPVALTSLARCAGCGKCMLMHADLAQL
jgi:hypothetical protein